MAVSGLRKNIGNRSVGFCHEAAHLKRQKNTSLNSCPNSRPNSRPCVSGVVPVSLPRPLSEESMRLSRFFLPNLRETPKEAEIASHRLMLRAGMIRQEAAGIYAF